MPNAEIYYFSGTGNSFFAAKTLQSDLSDSILCPIASLVGLENIKSTATAVGFVFPIHLSTIPIFILDFIKQIDLSSVEYVFAVATRIGTQHSAFSQLEKALAKKNKKLNAAVSLNMPSNDPKFGFKVLSPDEMAVQQQAMADKLKILAEAVSSRADFREKDTTYTTRIPLVGAIAWLVKLTDNLQQKFYADDKCTGCGTCARVCPSGRIVMKEGRPLWRKEIKCFKCNACLNFCPSQAVQIKGFTEGKGRYDHPYASALEIEQQKYGK